MKKLVLYSFIVIASFWPAISFAGGVNRFGGVGPRAGGMSGAYIAVSDDVSAFYYNPAGLIQIDETYLFVGSELMLPRFRYKTPNVFGGFSETSRSDAYHLLPLFGVVQPLSDRIALGLGINVPYGLGASFRERLEYGFYETESLLTLTNVTPALAFRLSDSLSLGLGTNIGYGQFKYKAPFDLNGLPMGLADSEAAGWGLGGIAGLLWKPTDWFSWGLAYNTRTRVKFGGKTDFDTDLLGPFSDDFNTHFTFPARLGTGIALRPIDRWLVAFDANWYDYSGADHMDIDYDNLPNERQKLDWEDNYSLHLGTEYQLTERWALQGGLGYQTAAIPDSTVSPLTPDVTGWDVSAGIGYRWKKLSIGVSYIYAWGNRSVGISRDHVAPGDYKAGIHSLLLGINYRF